ncbi:RHO1 GDP-GTP exchange protein 2, partial [Coemansia sp. RSA 2611]
TSQSAQRSSSYLLAGDENTKHGVAQRMSRDLELVEWEQQHQHQHQRRWALYPVGGGLRRCPSAPSLSEHQSDSDVSYLTAFRDSEQHRRSRDSWCGGSSQLSDITVASSYVGTQFRGPLDRSILSLGSGGAQRLSVASSLRPWHAARSSVGSHDAPARPDMATPRTIPACAIDSGGRSRSSSPEAGPCRDSYESAGGGASAASGCESAGEARPLRLWRDTVAPALLASLGAETVAQQEAIHELISTELAYARDLELIDAVFVDALLARPDVMDAARARQLLQAVFFNYRALIAGSRRLCAQLGERQQRGAVVAGVGDIFDAWADDLRALVEYAVHVPAAQAALERELLASQPLAQFLADAEAAPGARRLPVQSFIGRPATRLARYPLLLDAVVKRAPADAPLLRRAAAKVRAALREIDRRTGEGAAAHRLRQVRQRLVLPAGARESLALDGAARRLVREGVLCDEAGARVLAFLFDNAL